MSSTSARKRKNDTDDQDEEPEIKTLKSSASEFRLKLKGTDPIEALKQFIKDNKEENINEYIKEGGSVSELLAILNNFDIKKNVPQSIPVFQAITIFIIKCMTNFPERHKELKAECRQLLSLHLKLFHKMLTAIHSPRQKKVALKLLTALISCDESLASEILSSLQLTRQEIGALAFARKQTDPTSVREHFIRFLMAFLIGQPISLVLKFLKINGLLTSIFGGLKSDSYNDLIMVLTTLKSQIIDVREINKTLKLSIFNTASICHLIGVYDWDPRANNFDPSQTEMSLEGRDEIRKCVHELLIVLLTNVKMGVVFKDPSIGTTHNEFNELVTSVISGFGKPWGDEMRETLFIKMLSACPDVIKQSYRKMDFFFSQFNSHRWIQGLSFFSKLISHLDIQVSMLPLKTRSNLIKSVFIPSLIVPKLVKSLTSEDITCRLEALKCFNTCLKRLISYEQYYVPAIINNFLVSNISCASKLIENIEFFSESDRLEDEKYFNGLLLALECLLYSHRICPQLLDPIRYKKNIYEMLKECLNRIKLKISKKSNEAMELSDSQAEEDLKYKLICIKLIGLFLIIWPLDSSQNDSDGWVEDFSEFICSLPEVVQDSLTIMKQLLKCSGFFMDHCMEELDIWMYSLSRSLNRDTVKLIIDSIKYAGNKPKSLYSDLLKAEKFLTINDEVQSISVSLDDFIDVSEDGEIKEVAAVKYENSFSLSLPLLSLLSILNKEHSFKESDEFVISLLVHLLHHQNNSEVFVALLKFYKKGNAASLVLEYAEPWTESSGCCLLVPPSFNEQSIFYLTSLFLMNETPELPDIKSLNQYECKLLISQVLFCSMRGCNITSASLLLRAILSESNTRMPKSLNYQPLVHSFHPLTDLDSPANSTKLVMVLSEFSSKLHSPLTSFQSRLAFVLRYALKKRVELKDCRTYISKILNVIKLSEEEIKYLLEVCCPLPKKLSHMSSDWKPIQGYLLKEAVRLNLKLKQNSLEEFLNEILLLLPDLSTTEDAEFLDILCKYLVKNYSKPVWDSESMDETLLAFLKELLDCKIWNEDLAKFIYSYTPVDLSGLSLNRLADMLESSVSHLSPSELSQLIHSHKSQLIRIVLNSDSVSWIDKLSSALLEIDFGDDENMKDIGKSLKKKVKDIHLNLSSVRLLNALLCKAHMKSDMFLIAQKFLLEPTTLQDQPLGICIAEIMAQRLSDKECCLSDELVKILLSNGLKDPFPHLIRLLSTSVRAKRTSLSPKEIFSLLTSHSSFLGALLSKQTDIKYEVLLLVETLIKRDNSIMKQSHLPVYFSAYHATLSRHDQVLFQIIKMYEESGINLSKFKPFVWGETAAQRYSRGLERKTLDEESDEPTILLLNTDTVRNTIKYFPIHRTVSGTEVKEIEKGDEIYDVLFILGAVSQAVGPHSSVYPNIIPCAGITALAFMAVGSNCPVIRAAGYHVLHRHYTSLNWHKDHQIWSNLIEKFRRTICGTGNARLNGPHCVFLARASLIMSDPIHPLYQAIHANMLSKPVFRLDSIPAFLEFFHSSDPINGRLLQSWILDVIKDGLRDQDDLQILLSSFTLKLLMDYYSSKLVSDKTKLTIDEILEKCIACDSKRHLLTKEYSIIPWLMFSKKYRQALDVVPTAQRYAPLKKFIKHSYDKIMKIDEEEKMECSELLVSQ